MASFVTDKRHRSQSAIGVYGVDYVQIASRWLYLPEADPVGLTKKMVDPIWVKLPQAQQPFHTLHLFVDKLPFVANAQVFAGPDAEYSGIYIFSKPKGQVKTSVIRQYRHHNTTPVIAPHGFADLKPVETIARGDVLDLPEFAEPGVCFDIDLLKTDAGCFVAAYPCNKVDSHITFSRVQFLLAGCDYQYDKFLSNDKVSALMYLFMLKEMFRNNRTDTRFNSSLENSKWIKKVVDTASDVVKHRYATWLEEVMLPLRELVVK